MIPSRFEQLSNQLGQRAIRTILKLPDDLSRFSKIGTLVQEQGKIVFLRGASGIGKSSFLYSLPTYLPNVYSKEVRVPIDEETLPFIDIPKYIKNIPRNTDDKVTLVTVDRRESINYEDKVLDDFWSAMANVLRGRNDILVSWPIHSDQFVEKAVKILKKLGGASIFPGDSEVTLKGLQESQYINALDTLLQVQGTGRVSDLNVPEKRLEELVLSKTMGDFISSVNVEMLEMKDTIDTGIDFPEIIFVITSSLEANKLRNLCNLLRDNNFNLEARRVLGSRTGKEAQFWNARINTEGNLGAVMSFFKPKLVYIRSTPVVYACKSYGTTELKDLTSSVLITGENHLRSMKSTELYCLLKDISVNYQGKNPGKDVESAYNNIQSKSKTKHKEINISIMDLLIKSDNTILDFIPSRRKHFHEEKTYKGTIREVQTDVWALQNGNQKALEFFHKSQSLTTEDEIAKYIMRKLENYAVAYGLVKP